MPRTAVCPECENEQEIPANAKKVRCEECDTVFTPEAPQEEAAPARKKERKRKPAEEDSSGSRRLLLLGGAAAGVVVLAIVAFWIAPRASAQERHRQHRQMTFFNPGQGSGRRDS